MGYKKCWPSIIHTHKLQSQYNGKATTIHTPKCEILYEHCVGLEHQNFLSVFLQDRGSCGSDVVSLSVDIHLSKKVACCIFPKHN